MSNLIDYLKGNAGTYDANGTDSNYGQVVPIGNGGSFPSKEQAAQGGPRGNVRYNTNNGGSVQDAIDSIMSDTTSYKSAEERNAAANAVRQAQPFSISDYWNNSLPGQMFQSGGDILGKALIDKPVEMVKLAVERANESPEASVRRIAQEKAYDAKQGQGSSYPTTSAPATYVSDNPSDELTPEERQSNTQTKSPEQLKYEEALKQIQALQGSQVPQSDPYSSMMQMIAQSMQNDQLNKQKALEILAGKHPQERSTLDRVMNGISGFARGGMGHNVAQENENLLQQQERLTPSEQHALAIAQQSGFNPHAMTLMASLPSMQIKNAMELQQMKFQLMQMTPGTPQYQYMLNEYQAKLANQAADTYMKQGQGRLQNSQADIIGSLDLKNIGKK